MNNNTVRFADTTAANDIIFVEHYQPQWQSGDYTVTATQNVGSTDCQSFSDSFSATLTFSVLGPRFSLPPDRIHTQFPPPGDNGEYSNVLPHLVLTDRTLPWQRSPGDAPSGFQTPSIPTDTAVYPWLALLVFDQSDPAPTVAAGTIADLLPDGLPSGTVSYPDLEDSLEYGECTSQNGSAVYLPCQYIDVPGPLFSAITPSYCDLYWLAHARKVEPKRAALKATKRGRAAQTELSVVVANRLPTPGSTALCCLVSLEGLGPLLPPAAQNADTTVRLAVLSSWSFGCADNSETFGDYFAALNQDPATLQRPCPDTVQSIDVQQALAMGYTAFNHLTRQGGSTVSWYRGPLLPYWNQPVLAPPFGAADALMRYDPQTGMFDTSYAAAWQLGQLLALADKNFATTLYNWKIGQQQGAVADLETRILAEQVGSDLATPTTPDASIAEQVIKTVIKPLLTNLLEKAARP
ncbi:hypothetical protein [Mesorhizobium sp.]|uniref:hypothetical protein n=1 Tax=Mesorhizobium sp. TaxID=1871066 RepID=UPI000FE54657|nr:hypothetical protein [Mesorhizobium sp.]RWA84410.1 MAG: hypothetical protein EOQ30_08780 [Mesorhizobium sp.]